MKEMFHELYNKVLSLFNSSKEEIDPAKNIALNRLKTVLMQDRAGFSERAIQMMKEELILVSSKFIEIEPDEVEFEISSTDDGKSVLNLTIPIVRAKTDEEIDKAIDELEEKTKKKVQEIVKELESLIKERAQAMTEDEIDPALIEEAAKKISEGENKEEKEDAKNNAEDDKVENEEKPDDKKENTEDLKTEKDSKEENKSKEDKQNAGSEKKETADKKENETEKPEKSVKTDKSKDAKKEKKEQTDTHA